MEWISVTNRLPNQGFEVIICDSDGNVSTAWYFNNLTRHLPNGWYDNEYDTVYNVTHWMPLPQPPKQGE